MNYSFEFYPSVSVFNTPTPDNIKLEQPPSRITDNVANDNLNKSNQQEHYLNFVSKSNNPEEATKILTEQILSSQMQQEMKKYPPPQMSYSQAEEMYFSHKIKEDYQIH